MGQEIPYLGIFGLEFENKYYLIWNQQPEICLIEKLLKKKMKIPKFSTKIVFFGYFWARFFKKFYLVWNQHTEICQLDKYQEKTIMSKVVSKNALFGLFLRHYFQKKNVIIEISTLKFVNLVNFTKKKWCLRFWLKMRYLGFSWVIIFKKIM